MGSQVSRPLQILLGLVVLLAVLWMVALRPKSGSSSKSSSTPASSASATQTTPTTPSGPTAPGVKGLTSAIQKAHGAVATSQDNADALNRASDQAGGAGTPTPGSSSAPAAATPAPATVAKAASTSTTHHAKRTAHGKVAAHHGKTPMLARRPPVVLPRGRAPKVAARTLNAHRVLALLFYNPRAADDRAVLQAFSHINRYGGRVTVIAASLDHVADFDAVTTKAAVTGSPTFIVFDRQGEPTKLVGFSDSALMDQRVADALASH